MATTRPSSRLTRLLSNPIFGILGCMASILSIYLAFYFYSASKETRELSYYISPLYSVAYKADILPQLSVTYEGKEIVDDVNVMRIVVWNNGKQSIKRDNILVPLTINLGDKARILECNVIKSSREIVNVEIDSMKYMHGVALVLWDIFEQDDGAVIEVTYTGDAKHSISGVIEGQKTICQRSVRFRSSDLSTAMNIASLKTLIVLLIGLILFIRLLRFAPRRETMIYITTSVFITLILRIIYTQATKLVLFSQLPLWSGMIW